MYWPPAFGFVLACLGMRAAPASVAALRQMIANDQLEAARDESIRLAENFPRDPRVWHLSGLIQWRLLDYRQAEACTRRSLALDGGQSVVWVNLAAILMDLGNFDESAQAFDRAIALTPDDVVALEMVAILQRNTGNLSGSLSTLDRLVADNPENASLHLSRALTLIQMGRFDEGWREYEWRWSETLSGPDPFREIPRWDGGAIGKRRLFLWCDAMMGDALQFARFAGRLNKRFADAELILACPPPLRELFATSFPGIKVTDSKALAKDIDCHCPLMGLPGRLGPWKACGEEGIPYLHAPPGKLRYWKDRIESLALPDRCIRLGLAWSGNAYSRAPNLHSMALRRNMELNDLLPLLALDSRVALFSLQQGDAANQALMEPWCSRMIDWGGELAGFDDTAAVIAQLDLVVSVDTAVAHLAGGLGRPVWMLARYDTCWRWFNDRCDTPWYPDMRIFNQKQSRNWRDPVMDLVSALEDFPDVVNRPPRDGI